MTSSKIPTPPKTLGDAGRKHWRAILGAFTLEIPAMRLLETACQELDRAAAADAIVATDGLVIEGDGGKRHAHPAALIGRDARASFLRLTKALHLDLLPSGKGK